MNEIQFKNLYLFTVHMWQQSMETKTINTLRARFKITPKINVKNLKLQADPTGMKFITAASDAPIHNIQEVLNWIQI